MSSPFDTLHTLIVESSDQDAKYSPFGENITHLTLLEWPVSLNKEQIDQLLNYFRLYSKPDIYLKKK